MDKSKNKNKEEIKIDAEEMSAAGLFMGHRKSAVHPKMKPYISGEKNTIHTIDLEKTAKYLKKALDIIEKAVSDGKIILFVGTKIQIKEYVKKIAIETEMPYVNERWLGGTITNFPVIKKRIDYYKGLEQKKEKGELDKYTKKERIEIGKDLERLRIKFEGVKNLEKTPDILFVMDIRKDDTAIREAKRKEIPVIGISDTNTDPTKVDYPIPANDDAISSLTYILDKMKEAIKIGRTGRENQKTEKESIKNPE